MTKPAKEAPVAVEATTIVVLDLAEGTTLTRKLARGQGSVIRESEVHTYQEILAIAQEFVDILQFGTTFKLVEFLATQYVTAAQRMAEEHVEELMIRRAVAGLIETEEEEALSKIGCKQHVVVMLHVQWEKL